MAATLISSWGGNTDAWETSLTASIDVGSGSGRRMVGFIGQSTDTTPDITSASQITLAGSSTGVTLAGSATNPVGQTECVGRWFDIDIPSGTTGTVNLVINPGAGSTARKIWLCFAVYSGITAIGAVGYGSNTFDNNPTATVSSATGNEVVLFVANVAGGATLTASSPATALSNFSGTNFSVHGLRQDGASSVVIDGTYGSSQEYCTAYFSLTAAAPPADPTAGSATSITPGGATANWTDGSTNETSFEIETAPGPGFSSWTSRGTAAANATSKVLSGLTPSTDYRFRVRAVNASGNSNWSTSSTFTTTAWTYVRPIADITNGWSASTGTDRYALIDESTESGADYVFATAPGQTQEVKLGTMAAPTSGTSIEIGYTLANISNGEKSTMSLYCGATLIKADTQRTANGTYTMTVTSGEWAAVTDWTDLRLRQVSA